MALILAFIISLIASAWCQQSTGVNDLITDLPGLNFKPTFKQYSGYLNATDGRNLFYWLVESQGNPSKDPVVLWLQGGPGCSSLGGFLTELGPFHVNPDGKTLFENVFAWNKFSNLLFLEAPSGVGFSYSSPKNDSTDDDLTAHYNFEALRDFFYTKFPQYQSRDFYVTGESYAGVYIPTLAKALIDGIAAKKFPNNFKGVAIGNGILSGKHQFNSVLNLYYYHGIKGADEWNAVLKACCPNIQSDQCDFHAQRRKNPECKKALAKYSSGHMVNDEYNMYQDCYSKSSEDKGRRGFYNAMKMDRMFKLEPIEPFSALPPGTRDMSHQINYDSTDADFGFQCWADERTYLNNVDVKKALHVAPDLWNKKWCSCCDIPYRNIYDDMADIFKYVLTNSNIRILIYNGDVDLVCNFLGDQWFVERQVAPENKLQVLKEREAWMHRNQIAGFVKRFQRLDLLTVKGSGHFVPEDRPGPALQMLVNFVRNTGDYSKETGIDVKPKPVIG